MSASFGILLLVGMILAGIEGIREEEIGNILSTQESIARLPVQSRPCCTWEQETVIENEQPVTRHCRRCVEIDGCCLLCEGSFAERALKRIMERKPPFWLKHGKLKDDDPELRTVFHDLLGEPRKALEPFHALFEKHHGRLREISQDDTAGGRALFSIFVTRGRERFAEITDSDLQDMIKELGGTGTAINEDQFHFLCAIMLNMKRNPWVHIIEEFKAQADSTGFITESSLEKYLIDSMGYDPDEAAQASRVLPTDQVSYWQFAKSNDFGHEEHLPGECSKGGDKDLASDAVPAD